LHSSSTVGLYFGIDFGSFDQTPHFNRSSRLRSAPLIGQAEDPRKVT
jgi:hypothetical protein